MSATRLTFLYPHLLRSARRAPPQHTMQRVWAAPANRRCKSSFPARVGKAVAPSEWEQEKGQETEQTAGGESATAEPTADANDAAPAPAPAPTGNKSATTATPTPTPTPTSATPEPETAFVEAKSAAEQQRTGTATTEGATKTEATETPPTVEATPATTSTEPGTNANINAEGSKVRETKEEARGNGPLEAVMVMQPPEEIARQHPPMAPPRYVHHFDSYSLVKQLEEEGYTRAQAVTSMKAIRKLLAGHLDVAQESLVSKSDVENETYLFSAACSELSTEIKNNRRLSDEQTRQERTHTQHEVDILTQSLNQELLTLADNVRGMFNDRKMAAREEQKGVDSAVQKLNYKISIVLTSDAKSEIEGVRWILIRRSVLGIIFMAILTLATLRYATYIGQQRKVEAEKQRKEEEEARKGPPAKRELDTHGPDAAELLAAN